MEIVPNNINTDDEDDNDDNDDHEDDDDDYNNKSDSTVGDDKWRQICTNILVIICIWESKNVFKIQFTFLR